MVLLNSSAGPATELTQRSMRHYTKVTATSIDESKTRVLDVTSAQVVMDSTWSPSIQADLTCVTPDDLDPTVFDPRRRPRIEIEAGYIDEDNTRHRYNLGNLTLLAAEQAGNSGELNITAVSDEYLAQNAKRYWFATDPSRTSVNDFIDDCIRYSTSPETVSFQSDYTGGSTGVFADLDIPLGTPWWNVANDIGSRVGHRLWCDEFRVWHLTPVSNSAAPSSVHDLHVGSNGTIKVIDKDISREHWANAVVIEYQWTDATTGEPRKRHGRRNIGDPSIYSVNSIGWKVYHKVNNWPATQTQADEAAAWILRTIGWRGDVYEIDAIAAYWVRPNDTVNVRPRLTDLDTSNQLVQRVAFDLIQGTMRIATRLPFSATIEPGD